MEKRDLDFAICIIKISVAVPDTLIDLKQVCSRLTHKAGKELDLILTQAVPQNA